MQFKQAVSKIINAVYLVLGLRGSIIFRHLVHFLLEIILYPTESVRNSSIKHRFICGANLGDTTQKYRKECI